MDETPSPEPTKVCKECLESLPLTRFRIHQRYADGRSSRCRSCVKLRAERAKQARAYRDGLLEVPRYYWDGYTARCRTCDGNLYSNGEDVLCRACGALITTARQPTPLVLTRLRLLKEGQISA